MLYDIQGKQAFDACRIIDHFEKRVSQPNFDFKTAADKFRLIDENTVPVVIPYNQQAIALLEQARWNKFPQALKRRLQPYIVNIYEREFMALQDMGAIDFYGGAYAVLNDMKHYHPETGLCIPEYEGGQAIFFDG